MKLLRFGKINESKVLIDENVITVKHIMADFIDDENADVSINGSYHAYDPHAIYYNEEGIPSFSTDHSLFINSALVKKKLSIIDIERVSMVLKRLENEFGDFKYNISDSGLTYNIKIPIEIEKPVCLELNELLETATKLNVKILLKASAGHDNISFIENKDVGKFNELMEWIQKNPNYSKDKHTFTLTNNINGKKTLGKLYKQNSEPNNREFAMAVDRAERKGINGIVKDYLKSVGQKEEPFNWNHIKSLRDNL